MAVLGLRFCARAFSSCGKWGPFFIAVRGPLTIAASHCGAQAPDTQAQQLWLTGLVAPRHVGSSQTRARTRVPFIGRQILNHCATRETPLSFIFVHLITVCLGMFLLGFILPGTLCVSWSSGCSQSFLLVAVILVSDFSPPELGFRFLTFQISHLTVCGNKFVLF